MLVLSEARVLHYSAGKIGLVFFLGNVGYLIGAPAVRAVVLPDGRNEHGGGIPADHGRWSRCRRACSSRRRCSSGCRHHSAVISATAIRAEDSSTIAFFVA